MKLTADQFKQSKLSDENQTLRLQALLQLEADIRRQKSVTALTLWAVNELGGLVDHSQCLLFRLTRNDKARATGVSSQANVDRNSPFIRWVESKVFGVVVDLKKLPEIERANVVELALVDAQNKSHRSQNPAEVYPFQHAIFVPMVDHFGNIFGGLLFTRTKPWRENEKVISSRLAAALAHGFQALVPAKKLFVWTMPKYLIAGVGLLTVLAMFIPVPMTSLAPAEIIADAPQIVAAPIDGVVARIHRDPNVWVKKGELLFEFENTELKANAEIAQRKELVAGARLTTAKQAAFSDSQVYRQLAVAKAEVELARAEKIFADRKLVRTKVLARRAGQLIYSDQKDWIGKPVRTGERVMEIADPRRVVLQIFLPVSDAINLLPGASVRLFLDADPLNPQKAKLRHAGYHAVEQPGIGLAYRVIADIDKNGSNNLHQVLPRIGLRGTAQIFGEDVSLGYYLFRKPISAARQYLGI